MGKRNFKSFGLMSAVVSLMATTILVPISAAYAQDVDLARPGAKNDGGVVNVTSPKVYPDLTPCMPKLRDPLNYKGTKRKILKQIEPGNDGWLFRTADFRTDFTMPDKTFDYMVKVNNALKAKGTDLYIVLQPPRAVVERAHVLPQFKPEAYDPDVAQANYRALIKRLNDAGIHAVDISAPPSDFEYFFKGDPHWRREGAQWSAEQVAKMVRENPQYAGIKKEEFSIEITWWLESELGELDEFVQEICGVEIPPERRPMWATTGLSGVSEDALFGDVTYPDIAIIGTSNTAHEEDFNFVGSLKQAMKADIRNRAMSAGGFSGSGLVFFASEEFQQHPPKILLWEFLSHHVFDDYVGFRQMLPAIQGECTDTDALAKSDDIVITISEEDKKPNMPALLPLKEGMFGPPSPVNPLERVPVKMHEVKLMDYLETKHIKGKESYLQLEVTEPETRDLRLSVLYANGDADTIDLSRSRRAENTGRYFVEFNPDIDQELMMMQIETDKPDGKVKARICAKNKDL